MGLVADGAEPGDIVVTVPGRAVHAVRYYLERSDADGVAIVAPADAETIDADRVWVVSRGGPEGSSVGRELVALRLGGLELTDEVPFTNLLVQRFERS